MKTLPESQALELAKSSATARARANYGYGHPHESPDEEKIQVLDYLLVLRKRMWLIIGITILATALAVLYMARQPDIYPARARVQVDLEDTSGYGATPKVSSIIVGSTSDPVYFNTQLQILTGRALLRRVAKTLKLEHDQSFLRSPTAGRSTWESVVRMFGLKSDSFVTAAGRELPRVGTIADDVSEESLEEVTKLDGFVGAMQAGLSIDPVKENRTQVKETRLIDINFAHGDPMAAAKVANTIAEVYVRSNLEKKVRGGSSAGDFLHRRIAQLQSEIRVSEEKLIEYSRAHEILSLEPSQNTVVDRLTNLNRHLLEAENDRKLTEARYDAVIAPGAAEAMVEKDNGQILAAQSRLSDLRQQRVKLLVQDTEKMPEVQEITKQIEELERQINESRDGAVTLLTTNLRTQLRQAVAREQTLRDAFEKQRKETLTQNQAAINYRIIQQEIVTNKSLLDSLLQRSKENDVLLAGIANNVYIVDYATKANAPIGPKRFQGVALAFLLSLSAGIAIALLINYFDDSLQSVDEVERALHLPALATVPVVGGGLRPRRFLPSAFGGLQLRNGHNGDRPELLLNGHSNPSLAEVYRHLRTTVLLSTPGRAPRTLLVTSSTPAEGKTTTAINMAVILARTGASVVIVDADMRHPRIHDIFNIDNTVGLSSILSSDIETVDAVSLVQKDEENGIFLLPSGPLPANPAELLGSEQMIRLLEKLGGTFKHIVIDSPPVTYFTDSVLLSTIVDGVLLVVQAGRTSRQIARRSRRLLQDLGARIFGVVLNQVKVDSSNYYRYDSYEQAQTNPETVQLSSSSNS